MTAIEVIPSMDFRVPNMGEGIESATVVRVLVVEGAAVSEGQDTVEVETEKSTFTIPAPVAGTIEKIQVKPGDKVAEGTVLMTGSIAGAPPQADGQPAATPKSTPKAAPAPKASSRKEIRVPDLGEGIVSGTAVSIFVKPGDMITAEQPILELETDKATIPIPSPTGGRVEEVRVQLSQPVVIGDVIAVVSGDAAKSIATLGAKPAAPKSLASKSAAEAALPQPQANAVAELSPTRNGNHRAPVPAGPATRRLARELGVDLHEVIGSASGGRVTQDDVKAFVRGIPKGAKAGAAPAALGAVIPQLPDFSKYGPIETKPFTALRKTIAKNLSLSWTVAPQVTQHDVADITDLEAGRKRFLDAAPKGSPKITMTMLAIKACVAALKAFPHFNASYDANAGEHGELILKRYYNIGIAVDTERGLVVPVIRDADKKSVAELARELADLADKARAGKLMPDEMRGGTFTITNLGGIGGTAFSPIINYPEVAILGLSRSTLQPIVRGDRIEPRLMLPLSLTYDHRVIDGADGARFTARLAAAFSDPIRMIIEG